MLVESGGGEVEVGGRVEEKEKEKLSWERAGMERSRTKKGREEAARGKKATGMIADKQSPKRPARGGKKL